MTGDFVYARLQKGEDDIPTAYPPKALDAWASRLKLWAAGKEPADLPRLDDKHKLKASRVTFSPTSSMKEKSVRQRAPWPSSNG